MTFNFVNEVVHFGWANQMSCTISLACSRLQMFIFQKDYLEGLGTRLTNAQDLVMI